MIKKPVIILLFLLCSCGSPAIYHGIPNLAQVNPGIYRGGQPTSEGWQYLHDLGVTNVVKLNTEDEGSDDAAEGFGMSVHRIPISLWEQMTGVNPEKISAAVSYVLPQTFIHCSHGQDRTGLVVACYRLKTSWTRAVAEREMLDLGFHKELIGLWAFWEDGNCGK